MNIQPKTTWKRTFHLIRSDVRRRVLTDGRSLCFFNNLCAFFSPSLLLIVFFRLQHFFYHKKLPVLGKCFALINLVLFCSEIHSQCQIDEGFVVGHAHSIMIHDQTIIGKNCTFMHQTAIGIKPYRNGETHDVHVVLEDDVLMGSGARILGPCRIGKGSRIGMNSVVNSSIPPYSFAAGVPARVKKKLDSDLRLPPENVDRLIGNLGSISMNRTFQRIREDLIHRCCIFNKKFTRTSYFALFFNPALTSVLIHRLAHWLDGTRFRKLAKLLNIFNVIVFKTEIGAKADIQGGLVLIHPHGVIINHNTKIGKNAVFYHHNTIAIGPRFDLDQQYNLVVIGDNVTLGSGARILGDVQIGNECIIGVNAVVTRSFPDNSIIVGIPAKKRRTIPPGTDMRKFLIVPPGLSQKPHPHSLTVMFKNLRKDIAARAAVDQKPCNPYYYVKVLFNPPALAVVCYRISHWLAQFSFDAPAYFLAGLSRLFFSVEISPCAEIGPGLVLAHASGIFIHENVTLGRHCILTFQNTLATAPRLSANPLLDRLILGDHILVGMGARIIGNLTIGDHTTIGANSVVTKSAPEGASLVGVPARNVASKTKRMARAGR